MYKDFPTPVRAGIMARESSNYELGVDSQITRARDLLARLDWPLGPEATHIIRENDQSAFHREEIGRTEVGRPILETDRPQFEYVLDMLWTGEIDGLGADHIDRIARDVMDGEKLINVIEPKGIMIATAAHGIIKPDDYGIDLIRREVARANQESRGTKRRSSNGKYHKAMRGLSNNDGGGIRAFGWEPGGTVEIQEELDWLAWAAKAVVNGRSIAYITSRLTARGVETVTGGTNWNRSSISGAITNPRVAGISHHRWVPLRGEDGEYIRGNWKPAISVAEWEEVCAILKERARLNTTNRDGWVRKYLGSQFYECGACDNGQTLAGTKWQYRCDYRNLSRNREWVDGLVTDKVISILSSPEAYDLLRPRADTADIRERTQALTKLHAQRKGTLELAGTFSKREIQTRVNRIDKDISRIEGELSRLQTGEDPLGKAIGPDAARKWDRLSLEQQRAVAMRLVRVIILPARVPKFPDPREVRIIRVRPRTFNGQSRASGSGSRAGKARNRP